MEEIALLGSLELELTIENEKVPILELETALEDSALDVAILDLESTLEDITLEDNTLEGIALEDNTLEGIALEDNTLEDIALDDKTLEASELDPLLRAVEDTILDELCVTLTVRGGGIGISAIEGHELHVAGRAVEGGGLL